MVDFSRKIKNSNKFRTSALTYLATGAYCSYPKGTSEYMDFWEEEKRRCIDGYTADDGDYITGYNYFYLNYCPIQRLVYSTTTDKHGNTKVIKKRYASFPDFYDYDYYYFQAIQEAEETGKHLCVAKARRKGFEQPYSEPVLTPEGFVEMGSLKVGDLVMNPDGHSCKIIEINEQGEQEVFEVELQDGRKVRCGENHLWSTINATRGKLYIKTTKEYSKLKLIQGSKGKEHYQYKLPSVRPLDFEQAPGIIDPYVLGVLLGDGYICGSQIMFSTDDQFIVEEMQKRLPNYTIKPTGDAFKYVILTNQKGIHKLGRELKNLGVRVKAQNKFIPKEYKFAPINYRLELLQGLMDTDGSCTNGASTFVSTSEVLVDDVIFLCRSLGIRCKKSSKIDGRTNVEFNNGHISNTLPHWEVTIITEQDIFKLPRKLDKLRHDRAYDYNAIGLKSIKSLGYKEKQRCIIVDHDNSLYITRDFVPTHNSYKGGSMLCRNFFLIPNSKSYVYASNKQYLTDDGILTKAWDYMDFIDDKTAWGKKRQAANTAMRRRASMIVTDEFGNKIEKGYKSEIIGLSLKDNPDVVRGKAGKLILWEEAGTFPELEAAWEIARPSVEQDGIAFGTMIMFGTGGDQGDAVASLRRAFYDPKSFNCVGFDNIWDEAVDGKQCGFFVPQHTNLDIRDEATGKRLYMDDDGNTYHDKAREFILKLREEELQNAHSSQQIDRYVAEHSESPAEAFTELSGNIFPKKELRNQLAKIRTNKKLQNLRQVGDLIWEENAVKWVIKKNGDIRTYPLPKEADPTGSIVIWEHPVPDPPIGLYIIGVDPYDHDQSGTNSLGSCFVYKRFQNFETGSNVIVAEYTGRPKTAEMFYENVRKLAVYYNARIMYENQNKGLFSYFSNKHCDWMLADQPSILKDIVSNSKVERGKGSHVSKEIKLWGEGKIKEELEEDRGNGNLGLNFIYSEPLLEELIAYNDKGNFDRCLLKNTSITTIDGFKPVQNITVGDSVLTANGNYNKVTWVDKHIHTGKAVELRLLGDYRTLKCTDNHPIYVASTDRTTHNHRIKSLNYKHFERADNLNYKYQFGLVPKRVGLPKCNLSNDLLYLIGWFLSDGWASRTSDKMSITLQKNQEAIADKLISVIKNYIDGEVFIKGNSRRYHPSIKKKEFKNYWRIFINSPKLHSLVTSWGCVSNNKQLPTLKYLQLGLIPLVIGFLEGDGHQKLNVSYDSYIRNDIECSSIYHQLLHQIRQILIDNNIWATIERTKNNQLRIHIQGNYINHLLSHYPSIKFSSTPSHSNKNNVYLTDEGFWVPIKKLNETNIKEEVYNFEVENNHTYIANGIATHNCMAFMQIMIFKEQLYNLQVKKKEDIEKSMRLFDGPLFKPRSKSTTSFDDNITTYMFTN